MNPDQSKLFEELKEHEKQDEHEAQKMSPSYEEEQKASKFYNGTGNSSSNINSKSDKEQEREREGEGESIFDKMKYNFSIIY